MISDIEDVLDILKEKYYCIALKGEFEAEGMRLNEMNWLKKLSTKAELDLSIKIGGCEAKTDIMNAIEIGANSIIAPMIESSYAMKKFILATKECISNRDDYDICVNIETQTGIKNLVDIMTIGNNDINAITIGRVDLSSSLGLEPRKDINNEIMLEKCKYIKHLAKRNALKVGVGGGISTDAIEFLRNLEPDYFETRKVVFSGDLLKKNKQIIGEAISNAILLEKLWLENKRNYYQTIANEDDGRFDMLQKRIDLARKEGYL